MHNIKDKRKICKCVNCKVFVIDLQLNTFCYIEQLH